jgi:hypothetical protein
MLDVFIIEELKRREANRKRRDDRPRLELPLTSEEEDQRDRRRDDEEEESDSATIVIEM